MDISDLKLIKPHNIKHMFLKLNWKIGDILKFESNLERWRTDLGLPYFDYSFCSHYRTDLPNDYPMSQIYNTKIKNISTINSSPASDSSSSDIYHISPPCSTESQKCSVKLCDILRKTGKGQIIIDYYTKFKKLQSIHRTMLINIIATYFEDNEIGLSLLTSYRLERELLDMFPTEKLEYFRIGKRGKIYIKFCNLKSGSKKLKPKQLVPTANSSKSLDLNPEDDAEHCIKSLMYDNLSTEEFDYLWQACSQYRLLQITNTEFTIKEVFEKWPQYKMASGNRLIDIDFRVLHPEKHDIFTNWPDNFKKILRFLNEENRIKSSDIQSKLTEIKEDDFEKDEAIIRLLWCIHGFLVPTQRILTKDNTGNKITKKCTIKDSQEKFIYIGSTIQQLEDHIHFIQNKGENVQPLILAIGEPELLTHFEQYFIYVDGVKLKFNNILRAVDICFKMFYLFNLEYPVAGNHFWNFIQQYFYKITKNVNHNKSSKVVFMVDELTK